jgi:hypothetical protein
VKSSVAIVKICAEQSPLPELGLNWQVKRSGRQNCWQPCLGLIVIFESPLYPFYLDPVAYRARIDVRQLVVFPPAIVCLFQTVVLSLLASLSPDRFSSLPIVVSVGCRESCWIVRIIAQKPPVRAWLSGAGRALPLGAYSLSRSCRLDVSGRPAPAGVPLG